MDRDVDAVGTASESLVDGVVHDLVHQVVQPALTGRPDVHAGSPAYGLEALQDRDVLCVVAALVLVVRAPCGAIVNCQRSSDDIETPRFRATWRAPRGVEDCAHKSSTEGGRNRPRARSVLPANLAKRKGFAGLCLRVSRGSGGSPDAQLFGGGADACAKGCRGAGGGPRGMTAQTTFEG